MDDKFVIEENDKVKTIRSKNFNLNFIKSNGYTETWGRTIEEDPDFCSFGPIIADIEISEVCDEGCPFCYKSNNLNGKNMPIDTFKKVFHKLPRTLTQIALGLGSIPDTKYYKEVDNE